MIIFKLIFEYNIINISQFLWVVFFFARLFKATQYLFAIKYNFLQPYKSYSNFSQNMLDNKMLATFSSKAVPYSRMLMNKQIHCS